MATTIEQTLAAYDSQQAVAQHQFSGKDIAWLMRMRAQDSADKVFLIWEPQNGEIKTWTYSQWYLQVNQVACGLIAQGVQKSDKVMIHSQNCPQMMLAWYACALIGAVGVTTNTRCVGDELTYFAEHCEAVVCITQPQFIQSLVEHGKSLSSFIVTADNSGEPADEADAIFSQQYISFDSLFTHGNHAPEREAEPMLPIGIQYTSGTTSRPKAVVHTHANALWGGMCGSQNLGINSDDVYLCFLPCFHVNAQSWTFWTMMWAGGSIVLQPKFSSTRFWEVSLKHRCTRASMIPFCFKAIGALEIPEHHYISWSTGVKLHQVEDYWKVKTFATWGMTETVTHATRSSLYFDCPEMNIGMPTPGYEFAILDPETNELSPVGKNGDLWIRGVRGVHLFYEYYKNPQAMEASFSQQGWFKTGDQVRLGEDGYLYFGDRDKDVLKVGGENVSARQIEEFIGELLGVGVLAEHAVVAQSHEMLDEVPVVFAIKSMWTELSEEAIREKILQGCEEGLADFKRPRAVYFLQDFPRATLEKVAKNKLRKMADDLK